MEINVVFHFLSPCYCNPCQWPGAVTIIMLAENSVPVGTVIRKSMLCFLRFFFFEKSKKTFGSHLNDLQINNNAKKRDAISNRKWFIKSLVLFKVFVKVCSTSIKQKVFLNKKITYFSVIFQAGTGDEFLDELLSNDASLDEGPVPDIKVMDSSINMSGNEVSTKLISQPQILATS